MPYQILFSHSRKYRGGRLLLALLLWFHDILISPHVYWWVATKWVLQFQASFSHSKHQEGRRPMPSCFLSSLEQKLFQNSLKTLSYVTSIILVSHGQCCSKTAWENESSRKKERVGIEWATSRVCPMFILSWINNFYVALLWYLTS